jgi:hypothetical protein
VVVELGVPGPSSLGVAGSDGGGGTAQYQEGLTIIDKRCLRLMRVGPRPLIVPTRSEMR